MALVDGASHAAKESADGPPCIATPHDDRTELGAAHAQPVRILIVDELPIFRDGLRLLLASDARLHIVADTAGEEAATAFVRDLRPDILLLGSLPSDGAPVDVLRRLAAAHLSVRTILLVKSINAPEIVKALQFGACGVVPRDSTAASLFQSIDAVAGGVYWIGHERVAADVPAMIRRLEHARNDALRFGLTRREVQVVRGVVTGETNHQIAARLRITENTVKRHIVNVFTKVGASNRVELALFAVYHRLIDD
jgi:two-component system, NarL family, nitrate/nitrite response regulator NarL